MTQKKNKREILLKNLTGVSFVLAVFGLIAAGCATASEEAPGPAVGIGGESRVYISPSASPGVQDYFAAPVRASAGEGTSLRESELMVMDSEGVMVYFASSTDPGGPAVATWDGRDTLGNFVAQGTYYLTMSVVDDLGRSAESDPVEIVVDNTPPEAEVRIAHNVFAPGEEGERTVLPILQSGSGAVQWTGSILDNDHGLVRAWEWDAELPEEVEWDGRDSDGQLVADGRYSYRLYGADAAGNRVTVTQENIRVDTAEPEAALSANRSAFSPNDSGVRDTVTFETSLPEVVDAMEWTFSVLDSDDRIVKSERGEAPVPETITFAGTSDGEPLPEGEYRGSLQVVFVNGVIEEATSRVVTLDVTPPTVTVSPDLEQFSPEGDEDHRRLTIRQESSEALRWTGRIIPEDGEDSILSRTWDEELAGEFTWNGQTESGESAASGHYRYVLSARDRAGNTARVESDPFLLDREAPALEVAIDPVPFNSGAEEEKELRFTVDASDRTGIENWTITIRDPEGNRFARIEGQGEPEDTISWDGRSDRGDLPESLREYAATVTVTNTVGNRSSTERTIPIGLIVEIDDAGDTRLRVTGIHFAPFEAEFIDLDDPEVVETNRKTLDTVAEFLAEFPDQDVRIEGHAVHIFFAEERARREQEEVLLPLSTDRAAAIRDALVERGIAEERLSTEGYGGSNPVVPHDDMENRWKNRRVEFVMMN